jgi:hypothetical protein
MALCQHVAPTVSGLDLVADCVRLIEDELLHVTGLAAQLKDQPTIRGVGICGREDGCTALMSFSTAEHGRPCRAGNTSTRTWTVLSTSYFPRTGDPQTPAVDLLI